MKDGIKKYQFKHGLNHEFEIVDLALLLSNKAGLVTVPHRAQFYHILYIQQGNATHLVDFKPTTIKNNTILFVPHNSVNMFDPHGQYKGKTILFTNNFFCKNQDDANYLQSSILFSDLYNIASIEIDPHNSGITNTFQLLQTEYNRASDATQHQILHNLLHVFLLQAEREMNKKGFAKLPPSPLLDIVVLFKSALEKQFRHEKLVNKLASQLAITEKQLLKATTTLLDKTPKQLIDERVILEAKRLLVHSHLSIKEIAYDLGFEEPTNFIKYFRKHTSHTPSEFRERY